MTAYRIVYENSDGTRHYLLSSDGEDRIFESSTGAQSVIDNTPDVPANAQIEVYHTSQNDDNEKEKERARAEQEEREEREREEREREERERAEAEKERERERESDTLDIGGCDMDWGDFGWENGG